MAKHKLSRETRTLVYPAGVVNPEDLLTFVHFNHFTAEWKRLKLTDDDLRALEILIMASPARAPVIPGTGGLRKGRFAPPRWKEGKSGALRIGYVYFEEYSLVGLIVVYAKKNKTNITDEERKVIKQLIERFRTFIEKGG